MLRTFQRMSSNSVMFLLIIISMVVTKVFGNLHGAVDTLIVETDYGNVSSWEVGSYANLKSVQIPKSWRNPSNLSICHYFTIQFMENWLNLLQRWEASPKWWWGKSSTCSLEYHMPNPPLEVEGLLITTPKFIFFPGGENLHWFPFDWFTPDFGNQRRFPHGRVFWMGPKCQTLVFRLYPWILCISINPENSKIPCPVQCPSILRLMIGIKIGEIWVLPWFLWWGDVEPKHSIVRGKA